MHARVEQGARLEWLPLEAIAYNQCDALNRAEFDLAHLPHARSMPVNEIAQRLAELPKSKEIVAYCRGPFCLFAAEAAQLLKAHGRKVSKLQDGVAEWRSAGMPLEFKEST